MADPRNRGETRAEASSKKKSRLRGRGPCAWGYRKSSDRSGAGEPDPLDLPPPVVASGRKEGKI